MKNLDLRTCFILLQKMKWKKHDVLSKAYNEDNTWEYYEGWHDAIEELQKQIIKMEGESK